MTKKQNTIVFGLIVLAVLGFFVFNGLEPSAFTFLELQPQTVTQNGFTVSVTQQSFYLNQDLTGTILADIELPTSAGVPSLQFFLDDMLIAQPTSPFVGTININPPDNLWHITPYHETLVFSFSVPDQERTGQKEFKIFLNNQLKVLIPVYFEPSDCQSPNFVTYEEVLHEGTTVRVVPQNPNEIGFQISNPLFCHSSPILKQSIGSEQVFEQSNVEYDLLDNGSSVTVPLGQQWLVFYRGLPNINDVLLCQNNDGIWNATTNSCELPPTLYFVCNGVLTQQAECIVQATDYQCQNPEAVLEQQPNGTFTCKLYIPSDQTQFVCPEGASLQEQETGGGFCEYEPISVCNGELVNGQCVIQAPVFTGNIGIGGIGFTNVLIGVLIGLGGISWFLFIKKK